MTQEELIRQLLHGASTRPGKDVFLDIETYRGDDAQLEQEMAIEFQKEEAETQETEEAATLAQEDIDAYHERCKETNKKPLKKDVAEWEKIITDAKKARNRLIEKHNTFREKAALKDSAQIISVAIVANGKRMVFCQMPLSNRDIEELYDLDILTSSPNNEHGMLLEVASYLDSLEPISRVFTWAGWGFDIPKLRLRMGHHRVTKPECLKHGSETQFIDLMWEFSRRYSSTKSQGFCSLRHGCAMLGLDTSKLGDGSEVADLYESGQYVTLLAYNVLDSVVLQEMKKIMFDQ
jgi:hypothetical protein